jgi:tRNA pseudouridine38-40 synthase
VPIKLDADAMHAAAQVLVGRHDFTTFRDSNCQAESPVKTFDAISVSRLGEDIEVRCSARSFLHRQVRSIVGSLVDVGRGREEVAWIGEILRAVDRTQCGPVAPPDGLYLSRVSYEPRTVATAEDVADE